MARGWESKSVESQMDDDERRRVQAEQVRNTAEQAQLARERESLELSRSRIVREMGETAHPRRREQLQSALDYLDKQLKEAADKSLLPKG